MGKESSISMESMISIKEKNIHYQLGMVAHTRNLSTGEAEA